MLPPNLGEGVCVRRIVRCPGQEDDTGTRLGLGWGVARRPLCCPGQAQDTGTRLGLGGGVWQRDESTVYPPTCWWKG